MKYNEFNKKGDEKTNRDSGGVEVQIMKDLDWMILATLYRTRNITHTADILFLTQPALTKRIQKIEEELGMSFIIRTNKGTTFSPEGEHIARMAMHIVDEMQSLNYEISEMKAGRRGVLRIGVAGSVFPSPMGEILTGYRERYTQYEVSVGIGRSDELPTQVLNGTYDMAVIRDGYTLNLPRIFLRSDKYYAVNAQPFEIDDLPNMNFIWYPYGYTENNIIRWWHERFSTNWRISSRVDNRQMAAYLVQANLGFTITSDETFVKSIKNVTYKPLIKRSGEYLLRDTGLVWNKERENLEPLQLMLQYISGKDWEKREDSSL